MEGIVSFSAECAKQKLLEQLKFLCDCWGLYYGICCESRGSVFLFNISGSPCSCTMKADEHNEIKQRAIRRDDGVADFPGNRVAILRPANLRGCS